MNMNQFKIDATKYSDGKEAFKIRPLYNDALNNAREGDYIVFSARRCMRRKSDYNEYYWDMGIVGKIVSVTPSVDRFFYERLANATIRFPDGSTAELIQTGKDQKLRLSKGMVHEYLSTVPDPIRPANLVDFTYKSSDEIGFSIISQDEPGYVKTIIDDMNKSIEERKVYWAKEKEEIDRQKREKEEIEARKLAEKEIANAKAVKELDELFK